MNFDSDELQEFFVPILKLGDCIFVSIPRELQDEQARRLQDAVSERLAREHGLRGLVLDVSSLGIVDTFVAKVLDDTAHIAATFGTKAVLVGVRPQVAVTLVELGCDLAQVETALTLEAALRKLKLKVVTETL